jgi:hypothetical protein
MKHFVYILTLISRMYSLVWLVYGLFYSITLDFWGTWWGSWLRHWVASRKVAGSMSVEFFIDIILPAALWPWG